MTNSTMLSSMTASAKSNQIVNGIIPEFFFGGSAVSVNMVNMQIIFSLAMLACVIVSFKNCCSVASKVVVIFSFFCVLLKSVFIGSKPRIYFLNFCLFLARRTSMLWASFINKIIGTFRTHKNRADNYCASFFPHLFKCGYILLLPIGRFACLTNFLCSTRWFIVTITNTALFNSIPRFSFTMSRKGARLTTLSSWCKSSNFYSTIGAVNDSVCFHNNLNKKLKFSYYSIGGEHV